MKGGELWALRRFSVRVGQAWPGYKRKTFDAVLCASLYMCVCVCAVARVCEGGCTWFAHVGRHRRSFLTFPAAFCCAIVKFLFVFYSLLLFLLL